MTCYYDNSWRLKRIKFEEIHFIIISNKENWTPETDWMADFGNMKSKVGELTSTFIDNKVDKIMITLDKIIN